jgi:hypothetical protein
MVKYLNYQFKNKNNKFLKLNSLFQKLMNNQLYTIIFALNLIIVFCNHI